MKPLNDRRRCLQLVAAASVALIVTTTTVVGSRAAPADARVNCDADNPPPVCDIGGEEAPPPSTTPPSPTGSPVGSFDSLVWEAGVLYAQGRAADPDTTAAISVRMTVDGTSVRTFLAQVGYPADVPVPPDLRDRFSELVPVGAVRWPGRTVCLTALNAGPGADTDLGCRTAVPDETFVEAQCGTSWEYDGPPRSPILGSAADGIAPLALQEDAPVGDPIGASSNAIGFVRCIAQRTGRAVGAVFAGGEAWALEIVAPDVALPPGTTTVEFGNATAGGKWIVAHRTGFGEVASGWRAPFQKDERVVWRLSRSERGDGSFVADTIGFVKLAPWAVGVASFPPAIFWELADGMILHFRWA